MNSTSAKLIDHPIKSPRRHDLDALRALAMLLGILLHGIMSFCPGLAEIGIWPVGDTKTNELWFLLLSVIHGFRMPLFFLVSGYFTMMLLRKRGALSLLSHRFRRIFLPLAIGLVTIIPLGHWINKIAFESGKAASAKKQQLTTDAKAEFWPSVFEGKTEEVTALLESAEVDVNQLHPELGATPLNIATIYGHHEVMKVLLENGADVNLPNRDKNACSHSVAFTGDYKAWLILKEAGIDPEQKNADGSTIRTNCELAWSTTKMVASFLRLPLKKEEVLAGRKMILADLDGKQVDGPESLDIADSPQGESKNQSSAGWLNSLLENPGLLMHLWFLWSLFLLVLAFLVLAVTGKQLGLSLSFVPNWLLMPPVCLIWLVPLTMWAEWNLPPGFGPHTWAGIVPDFVLLGYYGLFFGYGAIYFHCDDQKGKLGWWWFLTIPLCLFVLFPAATVFEFSPELKEYRWVVVPLEVLYAWLMVFGSIGFFRLLLSRESKVMRYVSDSSYWLYVAHLPLVVWLQMIVRDWEMNSFAKATIVVAVASASLLITYQIFVRHTPIGWLLNGKRKRESGTKPESDSSTPTASVGA